MTEIGFFVQNEGEKGQFIFLPCLEKNEAFANEFFSRMLDYDVIFPVDKY